MENKLTVLTLNTWLLKTPFGVSIAKDIEERLKIIPSEISSLKPDIIALQEVWNAEHRNYLIQEFLKLGYPYYALKADVGGLWNPLNQVRSSFGNGLMVFSKNPMREKVQQLNFSKHTRADEIFVMKGAIYVQIEMPEIGWIDFYNSHLGAITFDKNKNAFNQEQLHNHKEQAAELANFLSDQSKDSERVIAAVDLGIHFHSYENGAYTDKMNPAYALLTDPTAGLGLIDSYMHTTNHASDPHWTYHDKNPYVASGFFRNNPNEVLDYIFVSDSSKITPIETKLVFQEPYLATDPENSQNTPPRLSDHYGVFSSFSVR